MKHAILALVIPSPSRTAHFQLWPAAVAGLLCLAFAGPARVRQIGEMLQDSGGHP
jgi:hypothetical protein